MKTIGGEFEINPIVFADYESAKSEEVLYSSGGSALLAILNFISRTNLKRIYLPYYICEAVIQTCMNG